MEQLQGIVDVFRHVTDDRGNRVLEYDSDTETYTDLNTDIKKVNFLDEHGVLHENLNRLHLHAKNAEQADSCWSQTWQKAVMALAKKRLKSMLSSSANTVGADGEVNINSNLTSFTFKAPEGKFDADTLKSMTLSEALAGISDELTVSPLSEWDTFAQWFDTDRRDFFNFVVSYLDCIVVSGAEYPMVEMPHITDFSDFLSWIGTIIGDTGTRPASDFWDDNSGAFVINVTLVKKASTLYRVPADCTDFPDGYHGRTITPEEGIIIVHDFQDDDWYH